MQITKSKDNIENSVTQVVLGKNLLDKAIYTLVNFGIAQLSLYLMLHTA